MVVIVLATLAVGLIGVSGIFYSGVLATGHVQLHAIIALIFVMIAGAIAWRNPQARRPTQALIIGLLIFAAAQLVESVGGFGYDAANEKRVNGFASVHDVGVGVAPIGLIALAFGLIAALAGKLARRASGRGQTVLVAVLAICFALAVVGFLAIMIGIGG
ncbi:MAG: hypothetical protein ABIP77_02185 [Candidatus Limnocylindrales bacterium]